MTKPTTEELKDLLGKVTPDWREDGMTGDEPRMIGSLLRIKTSEFHSIFVAAWLDNEKDASEAMANATLIALAPTLAAEVVLLRGLLWYAWREFNAIRARSGAPLTHDGMTTVAEEWWDQMTEAFEEAIGEDAAKPWPSPEARQALSQK